MGKRSAYEIHRCQIDVVGVYTQLSDCRLHDVVVGLFQAQKKKGKNYKMRYTLPRWWGGYRVS